MPFLPARWDLLEPGEGAGHDEEHVGGVDLDELLVRMLAAPLRRNRRDGTLEDLEQCLLHALARDIPGDGRVLGLAGDLVDLVDVDDAGFGALDVVVRGLDQLEEDVFHVFADVAGFSERRRIRHGEGHIEALGESLGEVGLATAGGTDEQDVGLRDLHIVDHGIRRGDGVACTNALVVVVDSDRERLLGGLLSDYVFLEKVEDLAGLRKLELARGLFASFGQALLDDLVAQLDTFITDVDTGTGDQLLYLLLALATEGTFEQIGALTYTSHARPPPGLGLCYAPHSRDRNPVISGLSDTTVGQILSLTRVDDTVRTVTIFDPGEPRPRKPPFGRSRLQGQPNDTETRERR
jgi:hypothetical protein